MSEFKYINVRTDPDFYSTIKAFAKKQRCSIADLVHYSLEKIIEKKTGAQRTIKHEQLSKMIESNS
jgi:hypothetical protein